MQRLRFKTLRRALPVENALDGSDGALGALASLLDGVLAPYHEGAGAGHELTLQCDEVHAKAWVAVARSGRVHGTTYEHRDGVVTDEELRDILESPFAFAEFAGLQARDKKVAKACTVWAVTSTARGSPTLPIRLIRSPSGKANQGIADESWRLWTILRAHGIPLRRLALDGDSFFVGLLNNTWPVMRRPQSWCLSLDISRQLIILKALSEYEIAITDGSYRIKVFRYDKLKPTEVFHLVGPIQADFCFTSEIFRHPGFSPGALLNDSASKMGYSIAARFVRVENLQRIRDAYDNVVAAIRPVLDGDGPGVVARRCGS
jgi:hypothetical protein